MIPTRSSGSSSTEEPWSEVNYDERDTSDYDSASQSADFDQEESESDQEVSAAKLLQELEGLKSRHSRRRVLAHIKTLKARDVNKRPPHVDTAGPEYMSHYSPSNSAAARAASPGTPQRSNVATASAPQRNNSMSSNTPQHGRTDAKTSSPHTNTAAASGTPQRQRHAPPQYDAVPAPSGGTPHQQATATNSGTPQRSARASVSSTPQRSSAAGAMRTPERRTRGRDSASSSVKQSPYAAQHNYFVRWVSLSQYACVCSFMCIRCISTYTHEFDYYYMI
jgi:hypothetical protein